MPAVSFLLYIAVIARFPANLLLQHDAENLKESRLPDIKRKFCSVDADCGSGSYCLNDPTKTPLPVFLCHGDEEWCKGDSDCAVDSFCMNGDGKTPAAFKYFCKPVTNGLDNQMPTQCKNDNDCKSYCMNDPTKQPPFNCHGGVDGVCETDDDCTSYCMIDPTKQPPYTCHRRNPPTLASQLSTQCKNDDDCKSYCMSDPTKQPPFNCHGGVASVCKTDDDCTSYCMIDPTKQPPYTCHRRNPPSPLVQRMNLAALLAVIQEV